MNEKYPTQPYETMKEKVVAILQRLTLSPVVDRGQVASEIIEAISEPDENGKCLLCQANVVKYKSTINVVMTKALIKISRAVAIKAQHKPFTEANNIYVSRIPKDIELTHAEKTNLNFVRLHGLIAKVVEDGKVQRGRWLITKRGWAYLRGEAVPATLTHFRNHVISTEPETITLLGVMYEGKYSDTIETLQRELATLPEDLQ